MRRDPLHHWLFEKQTGLIITVSTEQRDMILRAHPSLGDRIRVIFGGVNPERFRPDLPGAALVRADMGEKPDSAVAGIVAHLGYNRGHSWLLKAAPAVVEAVPNATLWIVGQGEIKYELREELRKPQYRRRVLMTGYRSADLPETYAAMDVGLLLGLGSEGSARAALEAMASGRPVIAVRKGSLCDTITDGKDGILVAENDVPSLQDALVRLLSNREEARRMGFAAREKILREFTENHRAAKTMAAYLDATRLRST
jgi:glycosyltransferase involved in cell wall biosynthesis